MQKYNNSANGASAENLGYFWTTNRDASLSARLKRIEKLNDPGTIADEFLKFGQIGLFISLVFTGLLSGFSYYHYFAPSFGSLIAIVMAVSAQCIIEWGKFGAFKRALVLPFFIGFRRILSAAHSTFLWIALCIIATLCFAVSLYNSTKGGEYLSEVLYRKNHESQFAPNTQSVDTLIAAANARISSNNNNTWRGKVVVHSQRANARESAAVALLMQQRTDLIAQQLSEYNKKKHNEQKEAAGGAKMVLAAGGWIELIQFLVIIGLVCCMKELDTRNPSPTPSVAPAQKNAVFYNGQNGTNSFNGAQHNNYGPSVPPTGNSGRVVVAGFGQPVAVALQPYTADFTVSQSPQPVTQFLAPLKGAEAEKAVKYCITEINRDVPNYQNPQANRDTVTNRLIKKLDALESTLMAVTDLSPVMIERVGVCILRADDVMKTYGGIRYNFASINTRIQELKNNT